MKDFVFHSEKATQWVIRHDYAERIIRFLRNELPGLTSSTDANLTNHSAWQIKSNPLRTVYRLPMDAFDLENRENRESGESKGREQAALYLKHYRTKSLTDLIKYTLLGSKAKREWMIGRKLLKLGVSSGEPVAYGEKRDKGFIKDSFLLIKEVSGSKTLEEVLSNGISRKSMGFKEKRLLLERLSLFMLKLHSKAIFHKDIHFGNILLISRNNTSNNDSTSLFNDVYDELGIIDLHSVRLKGHLSNRLRYKNLAFLLYSMTTFCSRTDILQILKGYIRGLSSRNKDKDVAIKINRLINRLKARHMLSRTKRCLKNSSSFIVRLRDNYKIYLRQAYNIERIKDAITLHNTGRGLNPGYVIKNTPKIYITSFPVTLNLNETGLDDRPEKICVKEYKNPGIIRQVREAIFPSRAKKAWFAANGFIVRKQPTPLPIAMLEKRRFGLLKNSLLITKFVQDAVPVYLYVSEGIRSEINSGQKAGFIKKTAFIEAFARSFKDLHKSNIYHPDLKGGNILVKEEGKHNWKFYYLDLDRVSFNQPITERKAVKNLAQLNASIPNIFSFSDRMRFFKIYSGKKRLTKTDKPLLKKIIIKSLKRKHLWNPQKPLLTSQTITKSGYSQIKDHL